jgi:glycosyltransferase involved in cell wall biosynthesis
VAIHTRNQGDAAKMAKSFYLQYPIYKWITFKELRGLPREQFASELSKSCLAVWVDEQSSFGTFPLEAIECNTPVIGKIPNMIPEWMENVDEQGNVTIKQNGVWTNTTLNIPELIATYLKVWLEDSVPADLTDAINESKGLYTPENQVEVATSVYAKLLDNRISELKITLETLENAQKETTNA